MTAPLRKKRIALDMDEVMADVSPVLLDLYAAHFGVRLKKEEYWGKGVIQVNLSNFAAWMEPSTN